MEMMTLEIEVLLEDEKIAIVVIVEMMNITIENVEKNMLGTSKSLILLRLIEFLL